MLIAATGVIAVKVAHIAAATFLILWAWNAAPVNRENPITPADAFSAVTVLAVITSFIPRQSD